MTELKCKICGKEFTTKSNLNRHLKKKIPCQEKKKEFKCERCQKIFTTKQSLQIHMNKKNICKIKISNLELEIEKEKIKLKQEQEKTKQEEIKLKRFEKEFKLLRNKAEKDPSIHIDTLNINIQYNNIVNFENTNTLPTKEEVVKVLNCDNPQEAKQLMVKSIFDNPERPQNKNIIYPNKTNDIIFLLQDNEWKIDSLKKQKTKIYQKAQNLYKTKLERELKNNVKELLEITEQEFKPEMFDGKYDDHKDYVYQRGANNISGLEIEQDYIINALISTIKSLDQYYR